MAAATAIRQRPWIGVALAAACLTATGWMIFGPEERRAVRGGTAYFLDLNTREIFVGPGYISPVEAPSGDRPDGGLAGVRATVYTCGDPLDPIGLTPEELRDLGGGVGYVSKYTPEAREAIEERRTRSFEDGDPQLIRLTQAIRAGHLVATLDAERWYQADTREGFEITTAWRDACETGRPKRMRPDPRRQR